MSTTRPRRPSKRSKDAARIRELESEVTRLRRENAALKRPVEHSDGSLTFRGGGRTGPLLCSR